MHLKILRRWKCAILFGTTQFGFKKQNSKKKFKSINNFDRTFFTFQPITEELSAELSLLSWKMSSVWSDTFWICYSNFVLWIPDFLNRQKKTHVIIPGISKYCKKFFKEGTYELSEKCVPKTKPPTWLNIPGHRSCLGTVQDITDGHTGIIF